MKEGAKGRSLQRWWGNMKGEIVGRSLAVVGLFFWTEFLSPAKKWRQSLFGGALHEPGLHKREREKDEETTEFQSSQRV